MDIEKIEYNIHKGAYFNYLNKTSIDLSRYQIGRDNAEHMELSR